MEITAGMLPSLIEGLENTRYPNDEIKKLLAAARMRLITHQLLTED